MRQRWPSEDSARFMHLWCVEADLRSRLVDVEEMLERVTAHDSFPTLHARYKELASLVREIHDDRVALALRYGFELGPLVYLYE